MVSREHAGKAPRIAWSAFHDVVLAPPQLPRAKSSAGLQERASAPNPGGEWGGPILRSFQTPIKTPSPTKQL